VKNSIRDLIPESDAKFLTKSSDIAKAITCFLEVEKITLEELSFCLDTDVLIIKKMLSGCYDFDLMELIKIELILSNKDLTYKTYKKQLLVEKR